MGIPYMATDSVWYPHLGRIRWANANVICGYVDASLRIHEAIKDVILSLIGVSNPCDYTSTAICVKCFVKPAIVMCAHVN